METARSVALPGIETLETRRLMSGGPFGHDNNDAFVSQTNLVSDGFVPAAHTDANLLNPWGVSFGPTTPFWISDNNAGVATLYDGNGVAQPTPTPQNPNAKPLIVTIPGGGSTPTSPVMGNPTGTVFAGGLGFTIALPNGKTAKPVFLFVGEDGAITGWDPTIDRNNAQIAVDNSSVPNAANGAVYKGATLGTADGKPELFVTNFRAGTIEAYNTSFQQVHLSASAFSDSRIPAGFAPFNVQNLNGNLYVTYAKQNAAKHDDVEGAGNGFVDVYNTSGVLLQRFHHGKFLDSPWGVAQAPSSWGHLAGDILVGQFGSGHIDIFDAKGHFRGFVRGADEKPVTIDGLWMLTPGNGTAAGDTQKIYFTAGLNHEMDGLFGSLTFHSQQDDSDLRHLLGRERGDGN